jgi:hypothetical protein
MAQARTQSIQYATQPPPSPPPPPPKKTKTHRVLWPFLHPDDVNPFHNALSAAVLQAPGQRIGCRLRSPHHPSGYLAVDAAVRYGQQGVVLFLRPEPGALMGLVGGAPLPPPPMGAPPPPPPPQLQQQLFQQQQQYQHQQHQQHHGAGGSLPYGTMASAYSMAPPFPLMMGMAPPAHFMAAPPPPSPGPSSSSSTSSRTGALPLPLPLPQQQQPPSSPPPPPPNSGMG